MKESYCIETHKSWSDPEILSNILPELDFAVFAKTAESTVESGARMKTLHTSLAAELIKKIYL